VQIIFQVEGEENLIRNFSNVRKGLDDFSKAFRAAQKAFFEIEKNNYQSDNATGKSGRWQPLSPKYEARKISKLGFLGFVSLERLTDATYKSLTGESEHTVTVINKLDAAFGTNTPQAKAQHFGYAPRNLPARPLIDLSDGQLKRIGDVMQKEILGDVRTDTTFVMTEENYRSNF